MSTPDLYYVCSSHTGVNFVICNDSSCCNVLTPSFCANVQVRTAVAAGVGVGLLMAAIGVGFAVANRGSGSKEKESKR